MLTIRTKALPHEPCKVGRVYLALEPADRAVFRSAVDDREKWSAFALERELRVNGVNLSNDTIHQHRIGNCKCEGWPDA